MVENWKTIEGYPDYMVSDQGRVKSIKFGKERILKPGRNYGYLFVGLLKNNKRSFLRINRLVALAFIQNDDPEHKTQVGHLDESRDNNCVSNLCWCTPKENCNMPLHKKRKSCSIKGKMAGDKHPLFGKHRSSETKQKISEAKSKYIYCPELDMTFKNAIEAAKYLGLTSGTHIRDCCRGVRKHAGRHPVTGVKLSWRFV